tara:strand:+ start:739 stop:849 length:111 start_codon:yes stop_codon:yes gene_type:complete
VASEHGKDDKGVVGVVVKGGEEDEGKHKQRAGRGEF